MIFMKLIRVWQFVLVLVDYGKYNWVLSFKRQIYAISQRNVVLSWKFRTSIHEDFKTYWFFLEFINKSLFPPTPQQVIEESVIQFLFNSIEFVLQLEITIFQKKSYLKFSYFQCLKYFCYNNWLVLSWLPSKLGKWF